jgi:hypothetical protein
VYIYLSDLKNNWLQSVLEKALPVECMLLESTFFSCGGYFCICFREDDPTKAEFLDIIGTKA